MPERKPALPAPVKGLSLVSLFNDFASEMVYPVLPAFITGPLGGSALALGSLDGAADLTAAALKWTSGRLSDRKGWTKPLILIGYGLAVLIRPIISLASSAWQVIGFRVVDRVGKGLRTPPRDAVLASLTDARQRGRAFGFNRAMDHLGAVLGSLTAWALLQASVGVREVIGWSAVPGIVAVIVLAVALKGVNREPSTVNRKDPGGGEAGPVHSSPFTVHGVDAVDAVGRAYWFPVGVLVLLTVARLPETLLLFRLQQLGVPVPLVPLAWAGLHVVRSSSSYPGGWLTDRLGPRWTLALGIAVYVGTALLLATALGMVAALVVFLSFGLVAGLTEPAERVVVGKLAPVRTGRGFGDYQAVAGMAALPAGIAFGGLYATAGGPAALLLSAAVLTGAALLWIWVGRGMGRTS
ncbi:MAG TPA: MFS transporter [Gemmatimonadales bacterium]|jgi:MFS family permease|nr:MFS transporter [Gemmatimonadales bacterium]